MSVQAITLQSDSIVWAGPATITEKLQHTVVDVSRLTGQPREAFVEELATLVSFIYRGYDHAWLNAELQAQNLVSAKVLIIRNQNGTLVGFNIFRITEQGSKGQTTVLFQELTGLLPEYRGRNIIRAFSFVHGLVYRICHPLSHINDTANSTTDRPALNKTWNVAKMMLTAKIAVTEAMG
jgi:hypothetical protein